MKRDAHQIIYYMKSCKKQKYLIVCPVANSIHLQKKRLEKEKEEDYPDNLPDDHHEKLGAVGHLTHYAYLNEKSKHR